MVASLRAFRIGLYEEHLDEASYLYAQCCRLRNDPDSSWRSVAAFEQRLERHVDAIVVGRQFSLDVCRLRVLTGDGGDLFALVSVYCRQDRADLVAEIIAGLDLRDAAAASAISDALRAELPPAWTHFAEQALARDVQLLPLLAAACGLRHIRCERQLLGALRAGPTVAAIDALGRLRAHVADADLKTALTHSDDGVKLAALLALLRIGSTDALDACHLAAQRHAWPSIAFGLAGGAQALHTLAPPGADMPDAACLLGLGLLGLPRSLGLLFDCLQQPELAQAAARAMHWISGAELHDTVHVPAPVDESELFPRELMAWRRAREAPVGSDGQPFGTNRRLLSTDRSTWKAWLTDHACQFDPDARYRLGRPHSPQALHAALAAAQTDPLLRRYCAEELAIRYGCDVPFEVDMPVAWQDKALHDIERWSLQHASAFDPGRWYFAGLPCA